MARLARSATSRSSRSIAWPTIWWRCWIILRLEQAVVGGISLGSAVAVNTALRYPERVLGLVLSRPAWIDRPLPENVRLYSTIAELASKVSVPGKASSGFA